MSSMAVPKNAQVKYTGCFIMFSVITNIHNKTTKGPTLMELFTATGKLEILFYFLTTTDVDMGASIFFIAAMIRAFRSAKSRGNVGTNTLHEMHFAQ